MSCLVLLEESGNPGGELADCSLLSHHVVQVQLHLTHWGGGGGEQLPWQHTSISNACNAHTVNPSLCKLMPCHVVQVAVMKESLKFTGVEREGPQSKQATPAGDDKLIHNADTSLHNSNR